jgi:hypothetical protein
MPTSQVETMTGAFAFSEDVCPPGCAGNLRAESSGRLSSDKPMKRLRSIIKVIPPVCKTTRRGTAPSEFIPNCCIFPMERFTLSYLLRP